MTHVTISIKRQRHVVKKNNKKQPVSFSQGALKRGINMMLSERFVQFLEKKKIVAQGCCTAVQD